MSSNPTETFFKPKPPTPGQLRGRQQTFPSVTTAQNGIDYLCSGLTKREWFAGMALQGILRDPEVRKAAREAFLSEIEVAARLALELADEMLERLEAPHG